MKKPSSRKLPPVLELLGRQVFGTLVDVGNRAVAAAAKSATKDGQRFVGAIQEKLTRLEEGLSSFEAQTPVKDDRQTGGAPIEAELVDDQPRSKKTRKRR